jgi:hypothetical protein
MARKRRQGRPLTFKRPQRRQLAELIRQHGVRGAQEVASTPISVATLQKIAREFAISLKKGRRPRQQVRLVTDAMPDPNVIRLAQIIESQQPDVIRKAA